MNADREVVLDSRGPVLVIGSSGVDIIGRLCNEIQPGTSNPSQIRIAYGGVARNVAENLARLGYPVILLSAVGLDDRGSALIEHIQATGVDTSAVVRSAEFPTGSYLAVVNNRGELQFALDDMRACASITPRLLRKNHLLFEQASLVYIDANLSKESLRSAITIARRAGVPIAADPTSDNLAGRLIPFLGDLYMISPNLTEAGILCEGSMDAGKRWQVMEMARKLVGKGIKLVILTLARHGVYYATSETAGYVPATRTEIIDPTGAGDALCAAVVFALLNNFPLDDAIRLGVSAASLTLQHPGAVYPDLTLEKLYDRLVI